MANDLRILRWWPDNYVDEVCPPGRESAEAWLSKRADGSWQLGGPTKYDPDLAAYELVDGQVVKFSTCEPLGSGTVHVFDHDGERKIAFEGVVPIRANWFAMLDDMDGETIAGSVDATLHQFSEFEPEPGDHLIGFECWTTEILQFNAATGTFSKAQGVC